MGFLHTLPDKSGHVARSDMTIHPPIATYAAKRTVLRLLAAHGELPGGHLRSLVWSAHRPGLHAALSELVAAGRVTVRPSPRGRYYRLTPQRPGRRP